VSKGSGRHLWRRTSGHFTTRTEGSRTENTHARPVAATRGGHGVAVHFRAARRPLRLSGPAPLWMRPTLPRHCARSAADAAHPVTLGIFWVSRRQRLTTGSRKKAQAAGAHNAHLNLVTGSPQRHAEGGRGISTTETADQSCRKME
jgi:hypothetical protein